MKRKQRNSFKLPAVLIFVLLITGPMILMAQNKPVYVLVTKIQTDRNKGGEYMDLIKNYGSKIWQDRVSSGEVLWVGMYSVGMSSGTHDYNYVSLTAANSVTALMEPSTPPRDILKKVMTGASDKMIDDALAQYGQVRTMKGSLIIKMLDGIEAATPPKLYEVDFMKAAAGRADEYVNMEKSIYKPIHQERIKDNQIASWSLWQVVYPGSDQMEFDYVTANGMGNWDKYMDGDYNALFKKVFPKGDMTKTYNQTGALRTMIRSEVWTRELQVGPNTK